MKKQTPGSDCQTGHSPEPESPKCKPPMRGAKTKTDTLRKRLLCPTGTTVAQIQKRLIWQPHTVRAAISRLRTSGVTIKVDQSGKVARYRALPAEVGK